MGFNWEGFAVKRILRLPGPLIAAVAVLLLGFLFLIMTVNRNPLHIYVLPEGFHGAVEVTFDQAGSPPLEKDGNSYIYYIPPSGKLKTSSPMQSGPLEVMYADKGGRRTPVSPNELHGVASGSNDGVSTAYLFIGTKAQYEEYVKQL